MQFNEIPYNWQVPGTFMEVRANTQNIGLLAYPTRVLIMAQSLNAVPLQAYNITSLPQATALFGAGSMAEQMVLFHMAANPYLPLDVIAVSDAGGSTKAAGNFTVTGAWTENGTVELDVGGVPVLVPTAAGDTPAAFVTNAIAAINAASLPMPGTNYAAGLPVVASVGGSGNILTVTARHGGAEGNGIDLFVGMSPGSKLPQGMSIAVTSMAGGASNPSVSSILNLVSGIWYTDVVCPWNDNTNLGLLSAWLDSRYTAMSKKDTVAYVSMSGTYGAIMSWKASLNSKFRVNICGTNLPTPAWCWAASLAGVSARYLTDDPARQLKSRVLPGIVGPRPADRFLDAQDQLMLTNGCSTFTVAIDGTVALQRVVTENLTNAEGVADGTFHDIMSVKTASRIRYDWRTYLSLTYPNGKLAPDGSLAAEFDRSVATPKKVKGSWAVRMTAYEQAGWVQDGANQAALATFQINAANKNRLDADQPVVGIGNLMIFAGILEFA